DARLRAGRVPVDDGVAVRHRDERRLDGLGGLGRDVAHGADAAQRVVDQRGVHVATAIVLVRVGPGGQKAVLAQRDARVRRRTDELEGPRAAEAVQVAGAGFVLVQGDRGMADERAGDVGVLAARRRESFDGFVVLAGAQERLPPIDESGAGPTLGRLDESRAARRLGVVTAGKIAGEAAALAAVHVEPADVASKGDAGGAHEPDDGAARAVVAAWS